MSLPASSDATFPAPDFAPRCSSHPEQPSTRSCPRCGALRCARCGGSCVACESREALAVVVRRRAQRTVRFLVVCGVLALGFAFLEGREALAPVDEESTEFFAVGAYAIAYLAVTVCTTVAFLRWLHGAMRLAPLLGAPDSEGGYSPRAAVLWWFVPIAHYLVPYRIVRELHGRLGTQEPEAERQWTQTHFHLWWGFWLASRWVSNTSMRMSMHDAPGSSWVSMGAELLSVPAAYLAVELVREIQARIETRLLGFGPQQ